MKKIFFIFILSFVYLSASSQVLSDSVSLNLPQLPDSLLSHYHKVDSIRNQFNEEASKFKDNYRLSKLKIDSATNRINFAIDSLEGLRLPLNDYTRKLDSLTSLGKQAEQKLNADLDELKNSTIGKLNGLDLPPQYKEPIDQLTSSINEYAIKSDFGSLPPIRINGYSVPSLNGIPDVRFEGVQNVGDLNQITEKVNGYSSDVSNITSGRLNEVEQLPKTIENRALKINGIEELQNQNKVIGQYEDRLANLNDSEQLKQKAIELTEKEAIKHFAGKEKQLQAVKDKVAMYKNKHPHVTEISDFKKRPKNPMKEVPFRERVIPGLYFQYQVINFNLFDINPHIGYKLSGRLSAGAGWNHRFAYNRKTHKLTQSARIYGPRAYINYKLGKGFIAHLETEFMNTFVPSTFQANTDAGGRQWVWGMMTGMKKDFKIYKRLKGIVLLQYNLFDPRHKAPYADRLNSRIGLEYILTKK